MKEISKTLMVVLTLGAVFSLPAKANPEALGGCLTDSLNGKERKQLARWMFFSIAAHPEMSPFSNVSVDDRADTDEYVGKLVTRLMVEDCASELRIAQKTDPRAVQKAFELVGQVAMQEVMNSPDVMSAIGSYSQYLDQSRINSVLAED